MGITTILDPRCKTTVLLINYEDLLGVQGRECEDKVLEVKDLLSELMSEYHVVEDVEGSSEASTPSMVDNDDFLSDIGACIASLRPASMGFKSELDRYVDEELVSNTKNFNLLDWWKVAGTRYPTLRQIARDIYAIPVTIVASEYAFGTSCRVLSEHHSRLTSKMPEALMCSHDWIRNKYKGILLFLFINMLSIDADDEKNKQFVTFWSCLQDIQEGLQVIC
jgi:hypothetical protein